MTTIHDKVIDLEGALKYAQRSFLHCADQRLRIFNFFILYIVAISVGLYELFIAINDKAGRDSSPTVQTISNKLQNVSTASLYSFTSIILVGSLITTIIFFFLEYRNRRLIDSTKETCGMLESILGEALEEEFGTKYKGKFSKEKMSIMNNCKNACGLKHGNLITCFIATIFVLQLILTVILICKKFSM